MSLRHSSFSPHRMEGEAHSGLNFGQLRMGGVLYAWIGAMNSLSFNSWYFMCP